MAKDEKVEPQAGKPVPPAEASQAGKAGILAEESQTGKSGPLDRVVDQWFQEFFPAARTARGEAWWQEAARAKEILKERLKG